MTTELWPDKDLIHACVDDESVVRNLRTIKLGVRRKRTVDEARSFMRISFAHWIFPLRRRILFGGFFWSNLLCHDSATRALRLLRNLA